jgi:flavin reductase (DIM6/NTAB) family NADH-FMN oxidoreductase RutF
MEPDPVGGETYRAFMSNYPTGVAVVTGVDADGRPRGMTCSSLAGVSLAPPVVSVCLSVTSTTLSALRAHGYFGVNLLGAGGSAVARLFAGSVPSPFERVPWRAAPATGVPRLDGDTIAFAHCRVADTKLVGDHVVVFGEVFDADCGDGTPLLYGRRRFAGWPSPAGNAQAGNGAPGRDGATASPLPPAG